MPLYSAPATEFLTVGDQRTLIAAAQDVAVDVFSDPDGEERITYGTTPASEAAMSHLTTSFIAAIRKAAARSTMLGHDEAFAVALAEFVEAIRRHDLDADLPFSATIATVMAWAVQRADRSSDLVVVRDTVAKVYWRIMHAHDLDAAAAYATCRNTVNGLSPSTFMAVHCVLGGVDSIDPILRAEDDDRAPRHALAAAVGSDEASVVQADLVDWLWTLVSARQQAILRLRFGFRDDATEILRLDYGFRMGEELTDEAIAAVLVGMGRSTVQKERIRALRIMRDALEALDAEGVA